MKKIFALIIILWSLFSIGGVFAQIQPKNTTTPVIKTQNPITIPTNSMQQVQDTYNKTSVQWQYNETSAAIDLMKKNDPMYDVKQTAAKGAQIQAAARCIWWEVLADNICKCPDKTKYIDGACRPCSDPWVCCGVSLNTNVPFIGNCIEYNSTSDENTSGVTDTTAFPLLMGGLTKLLMSIILLICFVAILVAGVMIAASGGSESGASEGKKLIGKVISAVALLGASGVILRLINPNFFK